MANPTPSLSLKTILDNDKLTDTHFKEWYQNLRNVLKWKRKDYVLDDPVPPPPSPSACKYLKRSYREHLLDDLEVSYMMLGSMSPELREIYKDLASGYEIAQCLGQLFEEPDYDELLDIYHTHMVSKKRNGDGKGEKMCFKPKGRAFKARRGLTLQDICYYCGGDGHWRRHCPHYLEANTQMEESQASTSGNPNA